MSDPDVLNGASFQLNSFIGHEFELREKPSAKSGACKGENQICRTNYLAVTENSEQCTSYANIRLLAFLVDCPEFRSLTLDRAGRECLTSCSFLHLLLFSGHLE